MADQSAVLENDVPERPTRAPGVELSGEMEDSAYEDRPWLILRDGTFVRVTELLYRVTEAADGTKDLDDVAGSVSEATGRSVSPDNVRTLVRDRLIPLGLVPKADGSVVESPGGDDGRSPIRIGMRSAKLPARFVEPLAKAFKVVFAPPLVAGVLVVGLAAVGWLFFVHGVGQGFRSAVYAPWLVLVLLPLVIASAAFHELGHAAALAYGGGKVRGMGAGFFTAYPVFYTDVTDNYRLKRWSRVRTDLGGFHFNLIFAALVTGVFLVTGLEFLLLLVLAVVMSIVQQAMPLLRLDGYWALADMTGIPDPTAAIGPAARSVVPLLGSQDDKAPRMKPWAKGVLLLWTAIAIPVLIVLLLFMLAAGPRIIGTGIESFGTHAAALGDAANRGDFVSGLAAVVSIAVLILTTVAFIWFVVRLIKGVMNRLWGWAGEDRRRRIVAGAGTLGMVALLTYLWAPPLPITGGRPGPFHDFRPLAAGERLTVPEALKPLLSGSRAASESGTPTAPETGPGTPGSGPGLDVPDPVAPPAVEPPVVPPAIDPPAVDPPAVDPPAVDPPAVDPPAVDPPAVDPPAVDPPAVDPAVPDPPAVDPPAVDPALPDPPAVDPPAIDPAPVSPPAVDPAPVSPPAIDPAPVDPTLVAPSVAPAAPPASPVVPLP